MDKLEKIYDTIGCNEYISDLSMDLIDGTGTVIAVIMIGDVLDYMEKEKPKVRLKTELFLARKDKRQIIDNELEAIDLVYNLI